MCSADFSIRQIIRRLWCVAVQSMTSSNHSPSQKPARSPMHDHRESLMIVAMHAVLPDPLSISVTVLIIFVCVEIL
jgi:hypothetical protein